MVWYFVLALVAGAAITMQAPINANLAINAGGGQVLFAALVSFCVGTVAIGLISLWKLDWAPVSRHAFNAPWWQYIGGLFGVLMVFSTTLIAPKTGVSNMLFFVILGQLIMAAFIDHFGWFSMMVRPISLSKIIGLLLILAGLIVYLYGQRFSQ